LPSGNTTTGPIVTGPDSNVWVATQLSVARLTPGGQVSEFCANPGPSNIVSGPDGKIWFGTNIAYQPSPFVTSPCATSDAGLREISTTGTPSTITLPGYPTGNLIAGPVLAPDGTVWAQVYNTPGNATLENLNASGAVTQTFAPLLNNSPFTGNQYPAIAADGSFWYGGSLGVVKCTTAGGCTGEPQINPFMQSPFVS